MISLYRYTSLVMENDTSGCNCRKLFECIAFEGFLALFVAMVFPVMELVLEAVLNEKLRKVGDKVRAHHQVLERYYESKNRQQQ